MEISNLFLFVAISLILLISPGPNIINVITKGMTEGRKAAFKAVLGASVGDLVQVLAASFGLALLLQASALAFFLIKMIGAGYLFYIGIRSLLHRQQMFIESSKETRNGKDLFFSGFLTSALNPKTTLFFVSFLPQFIDNKSSYAKPQMLLLGAIFVIMGFIVMTVYAAAAEKMRFWIARNERMQAYFNRVTGVIFIGFGLQLALSERK